MPGNTRFLPYNKPQPKPEILSQKLVVELKNPEGESLGPPLSIPSEVTPLQLQLLVKELLKTTQNNHDDNHLDFAFFVDNNEIIKSVQVLILLFLKL